MGSKTLDLDPARHDELVAWVSHLPQFVATALSALLEEEVGDAPELKVVGGRALSEMTRLGTPCGAISPSPTPKQFKPRCLPWSSALFIYAKTCARRSCATSLSRRISFVGSN